MNPLPIYVGIIGPCLGYIFSGGSMYFTIVGLTCSMALLITAQLRGD